MAKNARSRTSEAAAAIDEVLLAESAARQAMETCREEAEAILEAGREDVRRINRLANTRVSKLHSRCNQLVRERISDIRKAAEEKAVRSELNDADRETLRQAVERLAARLTRPDDG